jgi:hypothetical protein
METLPLVFTSGWASGVNAYAVVLLLGLLGRVAGVDGVPPALERTDVLVAAGILYALEFVTDKIPYLDSLWDSVSTVIRPTVGAVIGALIAGEAADLNEAVGAATGGVTAFLSHSVKAGLRMAVNTSPEPASNVAVSVTEDFTVAGLVVLAVSHPWVAAGVAATLLVLGMTLVVFLATRIRRFLRRRRERRQQQVQPPARYPGTGP